MYYVYGVYNKTRDSIYIGQTNHLNRRIAEHNLPNKHFTGKIVGRWELIYQEECESRSVAIAREKELKSHRGRDFIRNQINSPG